MILVDGPFPYGLIYLELFYAQSYGDLMTDIVLITLLSPSADSAKIDFNGTPGQTESR